MYHRNDRIFLFFMARLLALCLFSLIMVSDNPANRRLSGDSVITPSTESHMWQWFPRFDRMRLFPVNSTDHKIEKRVSKGDTITGILEKEKIPYKEAFRLYSEVRPVYDLKRIRQGQPYSLVFQNGKLKSFYYQIDSNRYLKVVADSGRNFHGNVEAITYRVETKIIRGSIEDSLFLAVLEMGEKAELADMLASLFEYDIDFNRDIRRGDGFTVLVEKRYKGNKFKQYGRILAARFSNRDRIIHVLCYTDPQGKTAYYHPDGRAVQKMFLRCPLPFMRVTSGYGIRRHPVLGFSARHNGVDLAAPPGTRIRTTASGVVLKTGYDRIRGRYVLIRHPNRYVTHYYHLNRIRTGIKTGTQVVQGQIIGYVGRTGRVTGWHLHYGIQKNSRFINPLYLKSPSRNPVKKEFRQGFEQHATVLMFLLSDLSLLDFPEPVQRLFSGIGRAHSVSASESRIIQ